MEGLYGSINKSGMQKILDALAAKCGLDGSSRLVDIGAGLGRCGRAQGGQWAMPLGRVWRPGRQPGWRPAVRARCAASVYPRLAPERACPPLLDPNHHHPTHTTHPNHPPG